MKNTKARLIAALMAAIMVFVLAACSSGKNNDNIPSPDIVKDADNSSPTDVPKDADNGSPTDMPKDEDYGSPTDMPKDPDSVLPTDIPKDVDDGKGTDNISGGSGDDRAQSDGIGTWEGSSYVSLHRTFSSQNGEFDLILTGLTTDSAAYVIEAMQDYDPDDDAPLRLEHEDFVDAEKWDTYSEINDDDDDSSQCWAASASNILLVSGWTEGFKDPVTGRAFDSEDTIFEYFNNKFTNRGCDVIQGIGWFFTGEFSPDWESSHPAMIIGDPDPADGIIKDFAVTAAVTEYSLSLDHTQIEWLEELDMNYPAPSVFEGSVGFLRDEGLTKSEHSLTVVGVITDPEETDIDKRYKAIILADSDNDGCPDPDMETEGLTLEQRNADKEARPNSYTVYKLALSKDANGTDYWEILNYSDNGHTALYTLVSLPMVSTELVDIYRETEGTCSPMTDPDFVMSKLFTTSNTESIMDPIMFDEEETIKTVFEQGEAVNLNFFIANVSYVDYDDEQNEGAPLTAEWYVSSEKDDSLIASGSITCEGMIMSSLFGGYLAELNTVDGETEIWPAGRYKVTVSVNTDHAVREAYFLNNREAECEFEIR